MPSNPSLIQRTLRSNFEERWIEPSSIFIFDPACSPFDDQKEAFPPLHSTRDLAILYSGSRSFRACSYSYKGSLRGSYGAPRPSPPHDCHDVPNVPHLVLGPEEKEVKLSDLQTELAACLRMHCLLALKSGELHSASIWVTRHPGPCFTAHNCQGFFRISD